MFWMDAGLGKCCWSRKMRPMSSGCLRKMLCELNMFMSRQRSPVAANSAAECMGIYTMYTSSKRHAVITINRMDIGRACLQTQAARTSVLLSMCSLLVVVLLECCKWWLHSLEKADQRLRCCIVLTLLRESEGMDTLLPPPVMKFGEAY